MPEDTQVKKPSYTEVENSLVYVKTLAGHDIIGVDDGGKTQGRIRLKYAYQFIETEQGPALAKPFPLLRTEEDRIDISTEHVLQSGKPIEEIEEMYLAMVFEKPQIAVPGNKLVLPN